MIDAQQHHLRLIVTIFSLLLVPFIWQSTTRAAPEPTAPTYQEATYAELMNEFGYGVSVLPWTAKGLAGFQWKKVYLPPSIRLPNHILYRVPVHYQHHSDIEYRAAKARELALKYGSFIEAYEIGNEVNLNRNGWWNYPNAADYVEVLCAMSEAIKAVDPNAIVVSAGLAPTGRIIGDWGGHAGHNGAAQDERAFMREFIEAGGADCVDVIGYHPVGFRADFDAAPDVDGGTPETNCLNGFCFRGVEKIREILMQYGYGDKKIWATEMGWLREAPEWCLDSSSWQGRAWQMVTPEAQAGNLLGAFQYAQENWSWMGAMFIFNYNFNEVDYYWSCEHMRYYSIRGQAAQTMFNKIFLPYQNFMPLALRRPYYLP